MRHHTSDPPSPWSDDGHVVIVGGGMAGLLAAAVCAEHYARVTIVERDRLDDRADPRRGVPQGRMLHALLPGGLRALNRILPGYGSALERAGAVPSDVPRDALILSPAGWVDRRAHGWTMLSASRPLLELVVRRRLRSHARVRLLDRHEVVGLRTDRGGRVRGVQVRSRDDGARPRDVPATLVVDAAGRGSRTPAWLESLDLPAPGETRVDADIGYASRVFRIPAAFAADWKVLMLSSMPPAMPLAGYLLPIEDDQWMVGLMGAAGQHPPSDAEGFQRFARSLRHPVLADAIAAADPVAPPRVHRGTVNRLRHYERVAVPDGLVALGEAVCAFNPVYGQGITTAAFAAETLDQTLRDHRRRAAAGRPITGMARRFQRRLARRNANAWTLSTGGDLRFPTTTGGGVTVRMRLLHRYLDRVVAATTRRPDTADAYLRVVGMLSHPASLFAPTVVIAAAQGGRADLAAPPPPAPAVARKTRAACAGPGTAGSR